MDYVKERVLIYPYGIETASVARYRSLLENFDVVELISPLGWALNGIDAGDADRGEKIGIEVGKDFDVALENCDTVMIADCIADDKFKKNIIDKMEKAISNKKNIICTLHIDSQYRSQIENKCKKMGTYFKYFDGDNGNDIVHKYSAYSQQISEMSVPVIFIAGQYQNSKKFEIQLAAREYLLEQGYKVSQIGTRHYCELFGFHSFPEFMYDTGITDVQKIVMFNKFVKEIEQNERPDIIIIGIPGELVPLSNEYSGGYGVLAFLISRAVKADFSIVSVLYGNIEAERLNRFAISTKYKFDFDVNCLNLANVQFDWLNSREIGEECYNLFESSFVDRKIESFRNIEIPVYNVLNGIDKGKMFQLIINTLSGYGQVQNIGLGG